MPAENKAREERLKVIENIGRALADNDTFRKVELSDPVVTDEDVKRVIVPFDNLRRGLFSKLRARLARSLAESLTRKVNTDTEIVGIENALAIKGGAMVTANHYNPTDSTPIRIMAMQCGRRRKLDIVVQQTNIFMTGFFGFLMRNCNTLPVCPSAEYMAKNLTPAIKELLSRGHFVLIYPEQEMWYNYKKPRALRDGAYHFAAQNMVPVLPTFTEMRNIPTERDENGFYRVKHILHILPPIYPDESLSVRENRIMMHDKDTQLKKELYERVYEIPLTEDFDPERDIAGFCTKD